MNLGCGWRLVVLVSGVCLIAGCGGGDGAAVDEVTSPIASYIDEEALDTISEEQAAEAVGAGELSGADRDRVSALQSVARRWAASSGPIWESLLDPDTKIEDFVALFEANRADLANISADFQAGVESIDDAGLEESFRPFADNIQDQVGMFEMIAEAVATGDAAALEAAGQRIDEVLAKGREAQDKMLSGMRNYIDVDGFCASLPDGGSELPELCTSSSSSSTATTASL